MLKDIVIQNRSYRGYNQDRAITREELAELVDCARLAPSSMNIQPLKYYIAWEKEEVAKIQSLTQWARRLPDVELPHPGMCPTAFVIILQDTTINDSLARFQKDCGIVAQTMLLRAAEMGLGGCMIGSFGAGAVREAVSLPAHLAPLLVVAIGEPAETVVLREINPGENTDYYRDAQDVHYVPKRRLEDILFDKENINV